MTLNRPPGRGYLPINGDADRHAFGAYLKEKLAAFGGRNAVASATKLAPDALTKWTGGRSAPSEPYLRVMCEHGLFLADGCATPEELAKKAPWNQAKYRKTPKPAPAPAANQEVEIAALRIETAQDTAPNLIDVILGEPNLSTKQRVQLTALVTMVMSGTDLQVSVQPR